jgi:hypothetical protein
MDKLSRRRFVAASALAFSAPAGMAAQEAPATRARDVGRKFNADGTVRPFGGNTFLGHIQQQGAGFDLFNALLNIYREFPTHAFASKISLTPPSSYHVTVFGGLNEEDKGRPRWPAQLPLDWSIDAVTRAWAHRLRARPTLADPGFVFEYGEASATTGGAPHLPLRPADDATAARLHTLRDELSAFTGLRDKDHDSYEYHMTFGYVHEVLSANEAESLRAATQHWIEQLSVRGLRIRIPAVQFCSIVDMYAFRVLHEL